MTNDNSNTDANSGEGEPFDRKYPGRLLEHGRERGLSRADREYLASGGETIAESENAHVNIRHRIRSRVRESIVDFWLLTEYLEGHDRELIFRESNDQWDDWELQIGLKSAMQFFYAALDESDLVDFETVLVSGISDAVRKRSDRPVEVDVDFDVEVNERFGVEEAYEKFQRGVTLSPREIGTLLLTGTVHDPVEIQRLSYHARSNSFIEYALTPLLSEQLSSISDEEERIEGFRYHWSHLPHEYSPTENGVDMPRLSDFYYLEDELAFQQQEHEEVTPEDLAEKEADQGRAADHEAVLRELSVDLDEPIAVGDEAVYEDGDRHPLDPDGDEKGAGSPADIDDDAAGE
jgi:hypothetical protein